MARTTETPIHKRLPVQLLGTLDKSVFKAFIHHTLSPGIKQNQKRLRFLLGLYHTPPKKWEKPRIQRKLLLEAFGENSDFQPFNQALSETLELLKDFLAARRFGEQPEERCFLLLDDPMIRENRKAFTTVLKALDECLENRPDRSSEYLRLKARREDLVRKFYAVQGIEADNTQTYLACIHRFALLERFKYACFSILYGNVKGNRAMDETQKTELTREAVKEGTHAELPVLKLFSQLFLLFASPAQAPRWSEFYPLLVHCEPLLPAEERKEANLLAIYYLNAAIARGIFSSLAQLRGVYQDMFQIFRSLAEDPAGPGFLLLREGPFIGQWRFLNVVATALYAGHGNWAESFISDGLQFVKPEEREITGQLSRATAAFYTTDPKKALEILEVVEPAGGFEYYEVYGLRLRVFYRLGDGERFKAALRNVREKLLRDGKNPSAQKIPEARRKGYGLFFERLNLIFDHLHEPNKPRLKRAELETLAAQTEQEAQIAQKKWLLEEIGNLIQKTGRPTKHES